MALVQGTNRAAGVERVLALLGSNPIRGKRVLLKPNFNSADAAPGSTHPEVLRTLILQLQGMGATGITVADRTCDLKTHRYGGHFTLSLKNSVGFVAKYAGNGGYNYMSVKQDQRDHGERLVT